MLRSIDSPCIDRDREVITYFFENVPTRSPLTIEYIRFEINHGIKDDETLESKEICCV